jgi:uncharacterized protein YggU (UPF0235/DUF167 family)
LPPLPWQAERDGLRLFVRLTPRGGQDALEGVETLADGRAVLKGRVRAAPEHGAANAALISLVAKALGVPKSAVRLVSGGSSRLKTLKVAGDPERLVAAVRALGFG